MGVELHNFSDKREQTRQVRQVKKRTRGEVGWEESTEPEWGMLVPCSRAPFWGHCDKGVFLSLICTCFPHLCVECWI